MTSREIVKRNITFSDPPRIAIKFDVFGFNDCYDIWLKDCRGYTFETGGIDEWGCVWERSEVDNMGRITHYPLNDWSEFANYQFPDPLNPAKYVQFAQDLAGAGEKFVMFCGGHGLFERFHLLRGFENALLDVYVEPEKTHELLDGLLDFHMRVVSEVHRLGGGRLDAVAIADDWGTESATMISPEKFREFWKPRYAKLFKHIHDLGMHTWLHSCGKINDVVDDLIDAGLDVVNSQQPRTVGIDEFGRRFAGRICFETIVDTQTTYPHGTLDEIRAEARELVQKWNTPHGGFIASDYNDAAAIGTTIERRRVAFETFAELAGIDPSLYPTPDES
jgi:hypothetical protein